VTIKVLAFLLLLLLVVVPTIYKRSILQWSCSDSWIISLSWTNPHHLLYYL